jgi:hypothetical protein
MQNNLKYDFTSKIIYMREPKRPEKTIKMITPCVMSLKPGKNILLNTVVDKRGYPVFCHVNFAGFQATVIVGHRDLDKYLQKSSLPEPIAQEFKYFFNYTRILVPVFY